MKQQEHLDSIIVNAQQMRQIEESIFASGMPVPALMEKAATLCATFIQDYYPLSAVSRIGVLVGPGHNGGDALVVARELHLQGYIVKIYCPIPQLKDLTAQHAQYARSLNIPFFNPLESLYDCELMVDGLFGFGLTRSLTGAIADSIEHLNSGNKPVVSIDIPSGLHTDTGEVLGIAVKATHSLCLGLWKQAYFQDQALEYIGKPHRLDFGILPHHITPVLGETPLLQHLTPNIVQKCLPLPRPAVTHKYLMGHLLLICGSQRYAGGAILTGLGARGSGVGMLSIAVPASLKPLLVTHLPDALIIDCPETESGAIADLSPVADNLSHYDIIACGPGLTLDAQGVIETILPAECPLILDADALNILAQLGTVYQLSKRPRETILTPHLGEFRRLFPEIENPHLDRIKAVREAAQKSGAIVLFKGARTAIANPHHNTVWVIGESTPALARGGSGDVLTGLMGGLMAQQIKGKIPLEMGVSVAAWWHAQGGILAAKERTELGVDAFTLSQYLYKVMGNGV